MSSFSLTQVVSQYTHFGPHGQLLIDLVPFSQPRQLQRWSVILPLGNCDHHGIILSLKWRLLCKSVASKKRHKHQVTTKLRQAKRRYFRRLKNANSRDFWESFNKKQQTFPDLTYRGIVMCTASKKANAFNAFFTTCFNQSFPQLPLEYAPDLPSQALLKCCVLSLSAVLIP